MAVVNVNIPPEPIPEVAIGLLTIFVLVLVLPFRVKKVEENLEPFFFVMGVVAVTISGLWSWELVEEAIKAPITIGGAPIGIFQVVLISGIVIYKYNQQIYSGIISFLRRVGPATFIFILVTVLGFISSIISVIVTAVILSEVVAALPIERKRKVEMVVLTCFSVALGAALTPVGEPLSTIAVSKLSGPPYYADFYFLFRHLGIYIIPGVLTVAAYTTYRVARHINVESAEIPKYEESLRIVVMRAIKVYLFVSALVLLGQGFMPLVVWYFTKIPPHVIYWVNMVSAILDNATLTAAEIGPYLTLAQIKSALMGLIISGGMLIPGNIPNIVAAGRLKITSREWARVGVPVGLVLMFIYFVILFA